ncbi:MAG TPA: hypothetical protein PKA64_20940, partial [Myxococcota bacterium]|nr:hypothetical protein [Myxococcota bacterium]
TAQAAFVQGRPPGDPRVDVAALMTDAGCPGVEPAWQGGAEVWTCVVGGRSLVVQHRGDEPDWLAVWTRGAQP